MSYYERDPARLLRREEFLKQWSISNRGGLTLLLTVLVLSGPVLLFMNYFEVTNEDGINLWPEPRFGWWVWLLLPLVLLWPYAYREHTRLRKKYWLYVYSPYGGYYGNDLAEQFVEENYQALLQLPASDEHTRALWLSSVQAYEDRDLNYLQQLHQLTLKVVESRKRLAEAQRLSARNQFVVQETQDYIKRLDFETEALNKELSA